MAERTRKCPRCWEPQELNLPPAGTVRVCERCGCTFYRYSRTWLLLLPAGAAATLAAYLVAEELALLPLLVTLLIVAYLLPDYLSCGPVIVLERGSSREHSLRPWLVGVILLLLAAAIVFLLRGLWR